MATYKPIKKWMIPLLSIIIGGGLGFALFPSNEDHDYNKWISMLETYEENTYQIDSIYQWDNIVYSKSQGIWSNQRSYYEIKTPISDGSEFSFETYLFTDKLYINTNDQWSFVTLPHRFTHELAPLDNPFQWIANLLKHADEFITNKSGDSVIYKATFKRFPAIDFRGTLLSKQKDTHLTMTIKEGEPVSLKWVVNPLRPSNVGPLVSYPDKLNYQLNFVSGSGSVQVLPKEAGEAEEIE
ncbi:hypothetical protein [Virgibacillus sp. DJP39]|uniref:hypothetical protein n=1 Tax=Virgibacillus sp. DJP39 TaxID=3409790 RepID=UPI003BB66236